MDHLEARAEAVFEAVQGLPADVRAAATRDRCGDDATLLARVGELLEAYDRVAGTIGDGPPAPPLGERPGDTIGPYKLLEKIGEGGFGVVFRAGQQSPVRREVALKVIKLGMDTREVVARFEAERQALALMDHPNIAKVFDAGSTASGRPYFVMELVRGSPITAYADQRQMTTAQRVGLMAAVCRAVQHAHSKGVIHRDLKPNNVLVTTGDDGRPVPKVIDFGIAKATQGNLTDRTVTLRTAFRQLLGTPQYMSPEQADSDGVDIDMRTDVYSLGVVLYELLTGSTPLDARSLRSVAFDAMRKMIRETEPAKPSTRLSALGGSLAAVAAARGTDPGQLGRQLVGELDWIVLCALEKDRSRRYETPAAMADDLGRHLTGEPVVAVPPSRRYRVGKFVRKHRAAAIVASAIVATLVLGIIGTTVGLLREAAQRRRADAALRVAEQREQDLERQAAADYAAAGQMAESRGDWANALAAFRRAEAAGYPDRLAVYVGQLRALDRLGRVADGTALANRVHGSDPAVAADPRFALAEGVLCWSADPARSQALLRQALAHEAVLPAGDRSFARALLTDDVTVLAADLRKAVAADPFNRDAWAVLSIADLLLGNLAEAEEEADVIRRIYPGDDAGVIPAAIAAALRADPAAANRHLDENATFSPADLAACRDLVRFVGRTRDIDAFPDATAAPLAVAGLVYDALRLRQTWAHAVATSRPIPTPLAFARLLTAGLKAAPALASPLPASGATLDQIDLCMRSVPSGIGRYARGVVAQRTGRYADAMADFRAATTMPSPIECRRLAAVDAFACHGMLLLGENRTGDDLIAAFADDFYRIGEFGGLRETSNELYILKAMVAGPKLASNGRLTALQWQCRAPDDPRPLYYQAAAEWHLGRRDLAIALLKVRLGMGDDAASRTLLDQISRVPTTQPAPGVRPPLP